MTSETLYVDFEALELRLARVLLEERLYADKAWWQKHRAIKLARLLDGVSGALNPTAQLLSNCVEEITPGDIVGAYQLAGLLLDSCDVIMSKLKRKH
jgi:hypothetical protein